jgi:hypothetical protein
LKAVARAAKTTEVPDANPIHTVDALVDLLLAYWKAGARGFILYTSAPYDHETIRRVATQVRPQFEAAIASNSAA